MSFVGLETGNENDLCLISVQWDLVGVLILTVKQVPCFNSRSNKRWVGTCLYQEVVQAIS